MINEKFMEFFEFSDFDSTELKLFTGIIALRTYIDLVFKRQNHFVAMGIKKFQSKQFSESPKSLIFHMNLIA